MNNRPYDIQQYFVLGVFFDQSVQTIAYKRKCPISVRMYTAMNNNLAFYKKIYAAVIVYIWNI